MEPRKLTICIALFVLAISQCSEAHSMQRREVDDEVNYDEPLGDEAVDGETMNDTDQTGPKTKPMDATLETAPTQYEVEAGQDVRLECKVNVEKVVVRWRKNNMEYFIGNARVFSETRYTIVNGSKDLYIRNTEVEDSGVYTCIVTTKVPASVNHTLLVTAKPEILDISASNDGNVVVGDDLELTCNITASPVPTVLWSVTKKDQNQRLTEKDAEFHVEGDIYSMIIKNVKRENAGQYYCYAINKRGSHQAEISVVINGKPQVHVSKTTVNSDINTEAVLQCSAHGDAKHIRWYKDNVLIEDTATKYVVSTQGPHSNLTVSPAEDRDFGTFTCEAVNDYGTHNRSIELVQKPVVDDLDVDGPKLSWTVHSHQPIEEMEVQLKSTSGDGEWTTLSVPVPEGRHHKYDISYTLEDKELTVGDYIANVKVKNTKGWGGSEDAVIVAIEDPQSLYIQTASVFRENSAAHSIRPVYTALSTVLMYLLVRML